MVALVWYLGSVETRGFIEVRNSDWETVARIADASALLDAQQVDAMINGFEAAWNSVKAYMPLTVNDDTSLLDGNGNQVEFVDGDGNAVEVGFTTDDWNIYTFANGELISTVNHWGGEHYWTSWDGTEYKNVDMGFHFHDQNWNSIANSGSHDSYRFDEDGELVHIQTSSHSGFTITEGIDAEGGPLSLLIEKE